MGRDKINIHPNDARYIPEDPEDLEEYEEESSGEKGDGCAGIFIFFIFTGSGLGYIVHLLT